jgi:hypothetical protein
MAGKIFINYRRGDDPGFAQALFARLEQVFSPDQLFMDVDNIEPGLNFEHVLKEQIAACDVLISVIGKNWIGAEDERGSRRLDNPGDFVRIEIESALQLGKRVIPVLVGQAQMPRAEQLPDGMKSLATRNAVRLTHERFRSDAQGLINALQRALKYAEDAHLDVVRPSEEAKRIQPVEVEREVQDAQVGPPAKAEAERRGRKEALRNNAETRIHRSPSRRTLLIGGAAVGAIVLAFVILIRQLHTPSSPPVTPKLPATNNPPPAATITPPTTSPPQTIPSPPERSSFANATLLGQYGYWSAFSSVTNGKKSCFAATSPISSQATPPMPSRGAVYLLISTRPADNTKDEFSLIMGYQFSKMAPATVTIGSMVVELYTSGADAWLESPADEAPLVNLMRQSQNTAIVEGVSALDAHTKDTFSTKGFAQALDRVAQECE